MCGFNKQITQFFNWITCLLLQHQLGKSISHFPSLSCIIPAKTWKQKRGGVKAVLIVIIFHHWHFHGMQTSSIGITHATEYCDVLASCTGGVWVCLDCKSPPQAKTRKITFTIAPSTGQEGRLIEENETWEDTVILPCTMPPGEGLPCHVIKSGLLTGQVLEETWLPFWALPRQVVWVVNRISPVGKISTGWLKTGYSAVSLIQCIASRAHLHILLRSHGERLTELWIRAAQSLPLSTPLYPPFNAVTISIKSKD